MPKKIFILLIISFGLLVFNLFKTEKVVAGTGDNVWGWAWSENIGWISFNNCTNPANPATCGPINYGVNIETDGSLSGYAWSRGTDADVGGIGWIKFDPVVGAPSYSACLDLPGTGQDCDGVGDYTVSGWARACAVFDDPNVCSGALNPNRGDWDGWIKLRGDVVAPPCGTPITFTYKGAEVTYETVENNGKCWMDRNLGASQVATAYNDSAAYGDLFQWGRLDDGHQDRGSGLTTMLSSIDNPGHSNFIYGMGSPYDWRSPQNNNLWQGVDGINNPCPDGWRIPTEAEWQAELDSWIPKDYNGAFSSPLKLTLGGSRPYTNGFLNGVGSFGRYWSSSVFSTGARGLDIGDTTYTRMYFNARAGGRSVRCVRDDTASNYGVWLDTSVSPAEFHEWAWGGDDSTSTAVVGWISFNCKDREAATGKICVANVTDPTTQLWDYKVMTDFSFAPPNNPPSANDLSVDPPNPADYCEITGYPPVRLHWQFSDDPGDTQSAFEIEIFRISDGVKVVDTGKESGNTQEYSLNLVGERLEWNTSYNWRLMVWDNYDVPSPWICPPSPSGSPTPCPGVSFTTSPHAWPYPDFTHTPQNPPVGQIVTFIDESKCYSSPGNIEYNCKVGALIQYAWDFDYVDPTFNGIIFPPGDATTTFSESRNYEVRLKITDYNLSPPGICIGRGDSPVGISRPLPNWIEVPPF